MIFLGIQEPSFVLFDGFFFEFLTPFTLGGYKFPICNLFLTIVSVSDVSRGGVQVLFRHKKKQSLPLGSSLLGAVKCLITGQSTLIIKHLENFENWCPHVLIP
jgi:hypothetical protein